MKYLRRGPSTALVAVPMFLVLFTGVAAAATAIGFDTAVSGTISAAGEVDWYSVTTDTIGDLKITQTAWPPYIETQIAVFGPNNQTQAQANPVNAAAPGTYYIKVWSANDGVSDAVYTFNASLTKAGTGNDIDKGGNSAAAAVPISLGVAVSDTIAASKETAGVQDVDWFTVTTDTVGDLAVTQTVWPPFIETRIAVFGPNDATLEQANPVTAAAPGTYYIKVWSANDGSSIAPYTFSATLTKAVTGNDIDQGANSSSAPVAITLGATVSDTIAPSKATSGKQDVDWFAVTTDTVGDLAVTQTAWPPFIETRIAIFGPNDATLAQGNPVSAAAPGTYYIKVWSYNDGSSIEIYTFSTSLTKAVTGNDIDKGANSASGAVLISLGAAVSDTIAPSRETAGKQDVDWYQVVAPVVGDLAVTQTAWPPFIETRIALFGPNDSSLALTSPVPNAAPGTYYIKVWSATDGSSIAPYTFSVSQKGAPITVLPDAGAVSDANGLVDAPIVITADAGAEIDGYRVADTSGPGAVDAGGPRDTALAMDSSVIVPFDGGTEREVGAAVDGTTTVVLVDGGAGPSGGPGQPGIDAGETGKDSGGCSACNLSGRSPRSHWPAALLFLAGALEFIRRRRRADDRADRKNQLRRR
jgi:hypothetical protein